jgi:hypothetical protein
MSNKNLVKVLNRYRNSVELWEIDNNILSNIELTPNFTPQYIIDFLNNAIDSTYNSGLTPTSSEMETFLDFTFKYPKFILEYNEHFNFLTISEYSDLFKMFLQKSTPLHLHNNIASEFEKCVDLFIEYNENNEVDNYTFVKILFECDSIPSKEEMSRFFKDKNTEEIENSLLFLKYGIDLMYEFDLNSHQFEKFIKLVNYRMDYLTLSENFIEFMCLDTLNYGTFKDSVDVFISSANNESVEKIFIFLNNYYNLILDTECMDRIFNYDTDTLSLLTSSIKNGIVIAPLIESGVDSIVIENVINKLYELKIEELIKKCVEYES